MTRSFWPGAFRRAGHVVAYGISILAGYVAAGQVLSYFYERFIPDGESDLHPMLAVLAAIVQGGFAVLFGVVAAALVFVAIVGVGGAILSQAWGRLAPIILERWSARAGPAE